MGLFFKLRYVALIYAAGSPEICVMRLVICGKRFGNMRQTAYKYAAGSTEICGLKIFCKRLGGMPKNTLAALLALRFFEKSVTIKLCSTKMGYSLTNLLITMQKYRFGRPRICA